MRVINILAHLMSLLLGLSFVMASCQREDNPSEGTVNATPIELSPSGEWSDLSRSVINDLNDLIGDGFVVWANWTKDPEDESIFTNDYGSGATNLVFGEHGTKVYATDGDGDGLFTPVQQILDTWYYTPKRYWQRGTYTFAAALPATAFNASCVKEESDATGTANITGTLGLDNTLTLTFGQDENEGPLGFDLATHQTDLMIAAAVDVDNTAEDQSTVHLGFNKHQFVQIEIQAACMDQHADIIVDEVTFYGNKRYTAGPMTFTLGEESITASYGLSTVTTEGNPYKVIGNIGTKLPNAQAQQSTDGTTSWEYDYKTIVSGLLVFPEECQMSLVVKYRAYMDDDTVTSDTLVGTISSVSVQWEQGMKYVYKLLISQHRVDIVGSDIMEWNEVDVEHTFS